MTQLEVFEKILVDGGKDYNKTITDRTSSFKQLCIMIFLCSISIMMGQ